MLITLGQAIAYVVTGMYGDVHDLGYFNAGAIVLQVRQGAPRCLPWRRPCVTSRLATAWR